MLICWVRKGLRLNLMKGIRHGVFKATQTWSKNQSVVIDLMTYFQWPRCINDLQTPDMFPSPLLTPLAVWHFAGHSITDQFLSSGSLTEILILDTRPSLFCNTHSEAWSQLKAQTDHRNAETTKQSVDKKRKWGTRGRLLNCLFSLSCNFPNISRHFTPSTLVIISLLC